MRSGPCTSLIKSKSTSVKLSTYLRSRRSARMHPFWGIPPVQFFNRNCFLRSSSCSAFSSPRFCITSGCAISVSLFSKRLPVLNQPGAARESSRCSHAASVLSRRKNPTSKFFVARVETSERGGPLAYKRLTNGTPFDEASLARRDARD